jgi:hypothetical protein
MRQVLFLLSKDNARGPSLCLHLPLSQDQLSAWNGMHRNGKKLEPTGSKSTTSHACGQPNSKWGVLRRAAPNCLPRAQWFWCSAGSKQPAKYRGPSSYLQSAFSFTPSGGTVAQLGTWISFHTAPVVRVTFGDCLPGPSPQSPTASSFSNLPFLHHKPKHNTPPSTAAIVIPVTCRTLHLRPRHFFRLLPAAADL